MFDAVHETHFKFGFFLPDCADCIAARKNVYSVFNPEGYPPRVFFRTRFKADGVARRMARKHPGTVFQVLKERTNGTVTVKSEAQVAADGKIGVAYFGEWNPRRHKSRMIGLFRQKERNMNRPDDRIFTHDGMSELIRNSHREDWQRQSSGERCVHGDCKGNGPLAECMVLSKNGKPVSALCMLHFNETFGR